MASGNYMNKCWLLISEVLWYSHESNFTTSDIATFLFKNFEKHTLNLRLHLPEANELMQEKYFNDSKPNTIMFQLIRV